MCTKPIVNIKEKNVKINFLDNLSDEIAPRIVISSSHASEVDGFILKSRSLSCGINSTEIFEKKGKLSISVGSGFFTKAIEEKYPKLPKASEEDLKNRKIRESFLSRVYDCVKARKIDYTR